ncbi:PREDICTED: seminal plasma protein BSP-30 kDa isoform X1 [Myotis brandtii]|uniref:seminal plasma protein BSP-30 kDa isoform X1 n=1 Tax=Myotis brandtii TaxID=109478 RepID=UPI0007040922|nr:PREDICTED: seminal plasma protein BSP-30 kDa isoform X1 [Myotis brandtii]
MEVMRKLAGWVSLMLCMCGLQAELNIHFHPPAPEYFKAPCVFPFTYDDLTYYSCISVHSDYAWCSLDERFHGRWRYCTAKDPPMCTFPFRFRDRLFQTCTKVGYIFNRTWCSLTSNYDADGKWKQCSPYNL